MRSWTLSGLGPTVHVLTVETDDPDLVYTFDLLLHRSWIPLRPGKPNRAEEPPSSKRGPRRPASPPWAGSRPGTIEGGDTFWLRPTSSVSVGRFGAMPAGSSSSGPWSAAMCVSTTCRGKRAAELVHLMSVISPVADDLAVVYLPLLPAGSGTARRSRDPAGRGPDGEFPTLGCNVLAVRLGVVIMADGNPVTSAALAAAGCEVHTYPATQIGINGSGGRRA